MAKARGELGTPSDLDEYKALSFSQKTHWGDFLDVYLQATRREGRAVRPVQDAQRTPFSPVPSSEQGPQGPVPHEITAAAGGASTGLGVRCKPYRCDGS